MKLKKIILTLFVVLISLVSIFPANAEVLRKQTHKRWSSFILANDGTQNPRIATINNNEIALTVDFYKDNYGNYSYVVSVIIPDNENKYKDTSYIVRDMQVRVDNKPIQYINSRVSHSNGGWFLEFGKGLADSFLEQAKKGHTIRIKLMLDDPLYFSYSLSGFTAAYNRAMSLFPHTKTDADYF